MAQVRLVFCSSADQPLDMRELEVALEEGGRVADALAQAMAGLEAERALFALYQASLQAGQHYRACDLDTALDAQPHLIFLFLPRTYTVCRDRDGRAQIRDERGARADYLRMVLAAVGRGARGQEWRLEVRDEFDEDVVRTYTKFLYYTPAERGVPAAQLVLEEFGWERRVDLSTVRWRGEHVLEAVEVPEARAPFLYHLVLCGARAHHYLSVPSAAPLPHFALLLRLAAAQRGEHWAPLVRGLPLLPLEDEQPAAAHSFRGLPLRMRDARPEPFNFYYLLLPRDYRPPRPALQPAPAAALIAAS